MTTHKSFVTAIVASMLFFALSGSAAAQLKTIEIQVPDDPSQPPTATPSALRTSPGDEVELKRNGQGNTFVVFTNPGKTPFVDKDGNPVYSFPVVQLGKRFTIPDFDENDNPCPETEPGQSDCKYLVVDVKEPKRPPLDPYIIIMR